jgi:hypothetical protein
MRNMAGMNKLQLCRSCTCNTGTRAVRENTRLVHAGAVDAFDVSRRSIVDISLTYLVVGDVNFLNHDCSDLLLQNRIVLEVVEASKIPDEQSQRSFGTRRHEIRNVTAFTPRR